MKLNKDIKIARVLRNEINDIEVVLESGETLHLSRRLSGWGAVFAVRINGIGYHADEATEDDKEIWRRVVDLACTCQGAALEKAGAASLKAGRELFSYRKEELFSYHKEELA